MFYYVDRFELLSIKNKQFLFLPAGVVPVDEFLSSEQMNLFKKFSGRVVSEDELHAIFNVTSFEEIPQIFRHGFLIKKVHHAFQQTGNITLACDDLSRFAELARYLNANYRCSVDVIDFQSSMPGHSNFLFLYTENYNEDQVRLFFDHLETNPGVVQCCYRMDRFLYLDNPHFPEIGNPDHFSNLATLKAKCDDTPGEDRNYFRMFRSGKTSGTLPCLPLNQFESAYVDFLLLRRIEKILGISHESFHVGEFNQSTCVDLLSQKTFTSIITHHDSASLPII